MALKLPPKPSNRNTTWPSLANCYTLAHMATADERIGRNLRTLREGDGQSQAELARRMTAAGHPWQQSTVARAEGGQQPLRAAELETLTKMFGVTLDAFFRYAGEAAEQAVVQSAHDRLRDSTVDAVEAVTQFHAARSGARQAARDGISSEYAHVREAAETLNEELVHATLEDVLVSAELRWEELRGDLEPADSGRPEAKRSNPFLAEALQAAAALYGQATVTTVTSKLLAHVTDRLTPDMVDMVIAAVAEVAREEQNGMVLRRIRHVGLERLAAEGIAAELMRRTADGVPPEALDYFLSGLLMAWRDQSGWESARKEFLEYIDHGGTSLLAAANLLVAKMPIDSLPAFIPLRERSLAELTPSRDQGVSETRPQPILPSVEDLPSAADLADAILGQQHKPLPQRERELSELLRVLNDTGEPGNEGKAS